jgi:hypothetical protein
LIGCNAKADELGGCGERSTSSELLTLGLDGVADSFRRTCFCSWHVEVVVECNSDEAVWIAYPISKQLMMLLDVNHKGVESVGSVDDVLPVG